MFDKLKSLATEAAAATRAGGVEKIKVAVDEVMVAIRALEPAGFTFPEVAVTMGLIPSLTVSIDRTRVNAGASLDAALQTLEGRSIATAFVKALAGADKLSTMIPFPGRKATRFEIELSVPPTVKIFYEPA
jgi:hypothetical protein